MAKSKPVPKPKPAPKPARQHVVKAADAPDANPLANAAGKEWLQEKLDWAEYEVSNGPDGIGWQSNETLRPAKEERAAFLRALLDVVEAAPATLETDPAAQEPVAEQPPVA